MLQGRIMYSIQELEKMLQQAYMEANGEKVCGAVPYQAQTNSPADSLNRRFTPKDEADRNYQTHRDQADKAGRAVAFFAANPAFSEFVELVRSGAIQF